MPIHHRRFVGFAWTLALAALLALTPTVARADEAHFLIVFASQRIPNDPDYSHTFATFLRASWPGSCRREGAPVLEALTISWLPRQMPVRAHALWPECGRNYGLHETIQGALATNQRVSLWGPYPIEAELYFRAVRQAGLLASGRVRYKAVDSGYPTNRVSNCIHAVSSLSEGHRLRVASPGWGEMASYLVLQELRPWVLDTDRVYPEFSSALGLDVYPIIYRDWQSPRSGALLGPVFRLFGGERGLEATFGPPVRW